MAYLINLKTFSDQRGDLIALDHELPFDVKRIYYIQHVNDEESRGGHSHHISREAMVCMHGSITAHIITQQGESFEYEMDSPGKVLIIEPGDWHEFYNFRSDAILVGISSTHFDHSDYTYDKPAAYDSIREPEAFKPAV